MIIKLSDKLWIDATKVSYINCSTMIYGGVTSTLAKIVIDGCEVSVNELELNKILAAIEGLQIKIPVPSLDWPESPK